MSPNSIVLRITPQLYDSWPLTAATADLARGWARPQRPQLLWRLGDPSDCTLADFSTSACFTIPMDAVPSKSREHRRPRRRIGGSWRHGLVPEIMVIFRPTERPDWGFGVKQLFGTTAVYLLLADQERSFSVRAYRTAWRVANQIRIEQAISGACQLALMPQQGER